MRDRERRLSSSAEVSNTFLHSPVVRLYFLPFCIFPLQAFYLTLRAQLKSPVKLRAGQNLAKSQEQAEEAAVTRTWACTMSMALLDISPFLPSALLGLWYLGWGLLRVFPPHIQPVPGNTHHVHTNLNFMPGKELCKPFGGILFSSNEPPILKNT